MVGMLYPYATHPLAPQTCLENFTVSLDSPPRQRVLRFCKRPEGSDHAGVGRRLAFGSAAVTPVVEIVPPLGS